jgi:adenine-specific DNA-methyltransferase
MILANLKVAGVQQAHKEGRISVRVSGAVAGHTASAPRGATWKATRNRGREARRHLHRPEFGTVSRPDLVSAAKRGRRCRLRRPHRLRLQLRGSHHRLQQAWQHPGAQGAHERRPAHGRGPEGPPARATCSSSSASRTSRSLPAPRNGQVRIKINGVDVFHPSTGEVRSDGADGHRLLVHRHRLQRGELLRPPRLLPGRRGPVQGAEDHPQGRDQRGSLGLPATATPPAPSPSPSPGRIAVKVINHLGDEVMKVFRVPPQALNGQLKTGEQTFR